MDHGLGLIIGILEILEIEVFIFPRILEILGISVFQFSHILEILEISIFIFPHNIENLLKRRSGRAVSTCKAFRSPSRKLVVLTAECEC